MLRVFGNGRVDGMKLNSSFFSSLSDAAGSKLCAAAPAYWYGEAAKVCISARIDVVWKWKRLDRRG